VKFPFRLAVNVDVSLVLMSRIIPYIVLVLGLYVIVTFSKSPGLGLTMPLPPRYVKVRGCVEVVFTTSIVHGF